MVGVHAVSSLFLASLFSGVLCNVSERRCFAYSSSSVIRPEIVVMCNKLGLYAVPSAALIPPAVRQHRLIGLVLDHNDIRVFNNRSFANWTDLRRLSVVGNGLIKVTAGALINLTDLRNLDLRRNDINLPGGLSPLSLPSSLRQLDLSHNPLERLPAGLFRDLRNLRVLRLVKARIAVVEPRWLLGLDALYSLNLFDNRLKWLPEIGTRSELDKMKHLRALHIGGSNPWSCDCSLFWLKRWIANHSLVVTDTPVYTRRGPVQVPARCGSPPWLRDRPVFSPSLPLHLLRCPRAAGFGDPIRVVEDFKLFGAIVLAWVVAAVGVATAVTCLILPEERFQVEKQKTVSGDNTLP